MPMKAVVLLVVLITACAGADETSVAPEPHDRSTTSPPASSSPSDTDSGDVDARVDIVVTGGEPVGGVRTASVDLGERVALTITSDTVDEVHVHGYDLEVPLVPGEPATLTFEADKPGIWEVELHDAGNLLIELQVG